MRPLPGQGMIILGGSYALETMRCDALAGLRRVVLSRERPWRSVRLSSVRLSSVRLSVRESVQPQRGVDTGQEGALRGDTSSSILLHYTAEREIFKALY